jgi:hypothetical protein
LGVVVDLQNADCEKPRRMRMLHRSILVVFLFSILATIRSYAEPFNLQEIQQAYAANNGVDLPLVSWMDWGIPKFLLYSDGSLMIEDQHSKSRLVVAHLSKQELRDTIKRLSAQDAFWLLLPDYKLTTWSDQPLHVITVRLPGRKAVCVSVYGDLRPGTQTERAPPVVFTEFIAALAGVTPAKMAPWDPGYVEIIWSDYDYAPDKSLSWPKEWPGLDSSLGRPWKGDLIKAVLVFPSSHLAELDAFFAQRPERGAVLINGKKMSGHYRWPLRGEKKWSTWNQ